MSDYRLLSDGKVPPQNIEAEEVVLGTCMVSTDAAMEVVSMINHEMFYKESHRRIFEAITTCLKVHGDSNMVIVTEYLTRSGFLEMAGGVVYITELSMKIVTDRQATIMATVIKEKYILRELIRIGITLSNTAFNGDLDESMNFGESEIFKLGNFTQQKEFRHIRFSMDELLVKIHKIINKEMDVMGVPSGITTVDRYTSGWQKGDLVIIAGRPSMGKTALALEFAKGTALIGHAVGLFSLEMPEEQLVGRMLSADSGITNVELKTGHVDDYDKLCRVADKITDLQIYIDDTSSLTLFELRSKAKKMILKHGIELIIVDYLQLMKGEGQNREQEVASISRGLKAIAKELSVPVIALSQLNRAVEDRVDKRPRLADLRESGAIEQDADMVMFVSRPEKYGVREVYLFGSSVDTKNLMILDISKHRNGALGIVALKTNDSCTRIVKYDEDLFENDAPFE